MNIERHKLGAFIEECDERNEALQLGLAKVRGMTLEKTVIPTKANLAGNDLSKFKVVHDGEFIYNPRTHGKRIGLGYNDTGDDFLISWNNVAFRIKDKSILNPLYLYMYFLRDEWDREACFQSWGSSTEVFSWNALCDMTIFVPPIEEQWKAVESWQGLRKMKAGNEQMSEPLMQLCRSYLEDCKKKYPLREIGPFICQRNEINREAVYGEADARGVNTNKEIQPCKRMGERLDGYKIVHPYDIVFNPNIKLTKETTKFAVGLYDGEKPVIVTNFYTVFSVDNSKLLPEFLLLFLMKDEFARYVKFMSCSSVRDRFDFSDLERVKIPLPPLDVQQAVVDLYRAANEAKRIAAEADLLSREMCPALIQLGAKGAA